MKHNNKILFLTLLTIASCMPVQYDGKPTTTVDTSTATVTTLTVDSPVEATTAISVYEYISGLGYKDCPSTKSIASLSQVSYHGVYPGLTSADDAKYLLGEPTDIINGMYETEWYYDNNPTDLASVIVVQDKVDRIGVDNLDPANPSLKDVVDEYGCPSLIFLTDRNEHSAGKYNASTFSYPEIGIEFWFNTIKVKLNSVPSEIRYFYPTELYDYIQFYDGVLFVDSPMSKPVSWIEVVVDK